MSRLITLRALVPTTAVAFAALFAAPAHAHVTVTPSENQAGSYTVLTVSLSHGCNGSATTRVAVQIPEPILSATPTRHPFWSAEQTIVKLAQQQQDAHDDSVTERVGSVIYTARTPLPDGTRDSFEIALKLPDEPGKLVFPAVQTCEKGQIGWVEVAESARDADDLDYPAPVVVVTPAQTEPPANTPAVKPPATASADTSANLAPIGLGLGGLGVILGGAALARARRRS